MEIIPEPPTKNHNIIICNDDDGEGDYYECYCGQVFWSKTEARKHGILIEKEDV